ncbi:hypothetical protein V8C86DRAFT_3154007 [Haematococcus lacustris]
MGQCRRSGRHGVGMPCMALVGCLGSQLPCLAMKLALARVQQRDSAYGPGLHAHPDPAPHKLRVEPSLTYSRHRHAARPDPMTHSPEHLTGGRLSCLAAPCPIKLMAELAIKNRGGAGGRGGCSSSPAGPPGQLVALALRRGAGCSPAPEPDPPPPTQPQLKSPQSPAPPPPPSVAWSGVHAGPPPHPPPARAWGSVSPELLLSGSMARAAALARISRQDLLQLPLQLLPRRLRLPPMALPCGCRRGGGLAAGGGNRQPGCWSGSHLLAQLQKQRGGGLEEQQRQQQQGQLGELAAVRGETSGGGAGGGWLLAVGLEAGGAAAVAAMQALWTLRGCQAAAQPLLLPCLLYAQRLRMAPLRPGLLLFPPGGQRTSHPVLVGEVQRTAGRQAGGQAVCSSPQTIATQSRRGAARRSCTCHLVESLSRLCLGPSLLTAPSLIDCLSPLPD